MAFSFKSCFGSSCDSHQLLLLVVISVLQTDFSTSIDWYINIISVNEITVFNCKITVNLLPYFYGRIPAASFFTVNLTDLFYSVGHVKEGYSACLYSPETCSMSCLWFLESFHHDAGFRRV